MDIKAVVFDLDNTLYEQILPFQLALEKVLPDMGGYPLAGLYKAFRFYSDEVFELTVNGKMSLEEMRRYRIISACRDFDISIDDFQADAIQKNYLELQYQIRMPKEIEEILTYLKEKGYLLAILTNGPSKHQRNKIKALNSRRFFDERYYFISGDLGVAKPEASVFRHAEKTLGLTPAECCMIGDSYDADIIGAEGAGWQSIWINKPGDEKPAVNGGISVSSYPELLETIKLKF